MPTIKSLNGIIAITQSKKMIVRLVTIPEEHHENSPTNADLSNNNQSKIAQKSQCKQYKRSIL